MTQSVSSNSITSLVSSKLTGALPAISGAALTGVSAGVFTSTSDPTPTSNKTLGFIWANSVTGDLFNCTDATTNNNVWINVGSGSGDVQKDHQGTLSGYAAGGYTGSGSNVIDKFSLASDANATDVGDLTVSRHALAGSQDETHGYVAGGAGNQNVIERFVFATNGNATDVGDLTVGKSSVSGHSSFTHGYTCGGEASGTGDNGINVIEKYAFASSGNGSDVGDILETRLSVSGVMSLTHGYAIGGRRLVPMTRTDNIEKFPFATDSNSTDHGDLLAVNTNIAYNGQQSLTHGYASGGEFTGNGTRLQKFAFATSSNATSVGTLSAATTATTGCSSATDGYCGGSGEGTTSEILKFSFVSDGNASDIGDLTVARGNCAGISN